MKASLHLSAFHILKVFVEALTGSSHIYRAGVLNSTSIFLFSFFRILFIYLFERMRERERGRDTGREGEVGSMQGAQYGTPSRDSGIRPWTEGRHSTLSHPGIPTSQFQGSILGAASRGGKGKWNPHSKHRGGAEEPQITQIQVMGQPPVIYPSWYQRSRKICPTESTKITSRNRLSNEADGSR